MSTRAPCASIRLDRTGLPSSEKAHAPASRMSSISASSSPSCPFGHATDRVDRARSHIPPPGLMMSSVTDRESLTGIGVGHARHAGEAHRPQRHAVPVATVSFHSCPGSRRWTCMSMKPGHTTMPVQVDALPTPAAIGADRQSAIFPSSISRSRTLRHVPEAGSTTRPFLSSSFFTSIGSPASRYSTAMRTATPLVTCSRMTERIRRRRRRR